jgi:hypothetical protein
LARDDQRLVYSGRLLDNEWLVSFSRIHLIIYLPLPHALCFPASGTIWENRLGLGLSVHVLNRRRHMDERYRVRITPFVNDQW